MHNNTATRCATSGAVRGNTQQHYECQCQRTSMPARQRCSRVRRGHPGAVLCMHARVSHAHIAPRVAILLCHRAAPATVGHGCMRKQLWNRTPHHTTAQRHPSAPCTDATTWRCNRAHYDCQHDAQCLRTKHCVCARTVLLVHRCVHEQCKYIAHDLTRTACHRN